MPREWIRDNLLAVTEMKGRGRGTWSLFFHTVLKYKASAQFRDKHTSQDIGCLGWWFLTLAFCQSYTPPLTGWLFTARTALHRSCMTPLTPAMPWFKNCCHNIWLPWLAASPDALLLPISLEIHWYHFITSLDFLQIWPPFSAVISRSSDHLPSCCYFFCSMFTSRSPKCPRRLWSRHICFSIQNLPSQIALGFDPPPHCASHHDPQANSTLPAHIQQIIQ